MVDAPRRGPRSGLLLAAALAVVAFAYRAALLGGFVWDDHALIVGRPAVHHLARALGAFARGFWAGPLAGPASAYYRPLTTLLDAVDWAAGGGGPLVFHLTSLGLHLGVCALVFLLARRLGAAPVPAALGTALFGTFPRLTESVAWISGRTDVLAAACVLGALLLWGPDLRRRLGAAALLLLGLLAKEVAIAGLAGAVVLELAKARRDRTSRAAALARPWPLYLATGFYLALRLTAVGLRVGAGPVALGAGRRLGLALETLGTYLTLLVDPFHPEVEIGRVGVAQPGQMVLGGLALLAAAGLAVVAWRRLAPRRLAALATGAAALVPVLHLVPLPVQQVACDRFLYLPLAAAIPVAAAVASGLLGRWRVVAAGAAAGLLVASVAVTSARVPVWHDDLSLWRRAVATHGDESGLPFAGLGGALLDRHRPEAALAAYDRAIRIDRRIFGAAFGEAGDAFPFEWAGKASSLEALGRYPEAVALFRRLARRFPGRPRYHYDLAMAEVRALHLDAAEATLDGRDPDPGLTARLRALVARTRKALAALPPEGTATTIGARLAWARFDDRLGRVHGAEVAFAALAQSRGVPRKVLREAAGWLALRGDRADAEAALDRYARVAGPGDPEVAALRRRLAERYELASSRD